MVGVGVDGKECQNGVIRAAEKVEAVVEERRGREVRRGRERGFGGEKGGKGIGGRVEEEGSERGV